MNVAKFISVLSWISVLVLIWLMVIHLPQVDKDRVFTILTLAAFVILASISGSIGEKKDDRTNKEG